MLNLEVLTALNHHFNYTSCLTIHILDIWFSADLTKGLLALQNFWKLAIFSCLTSLPITCLEIS